MAASEQLPTIGKRLVVMSGLPGVGKSSIAERIARHLNFAILTLDRLEAPLLAQGISGEAIGWSTYGSLTALADQNLGVGVSVVIDSVSWTNLIRNRWLDLAGRHQASFRPIEVMCSDADVHRGRVEGRSANALAWDRVAEANRTYERWESPRLVLDSARALDDVVADAIRYVAASDLTT